MPADAAALLAALRPGVVAHHHVEPHFAHLDFGLGSDTATRVWPRVVALAKRFSKRAARRAETKARAAAAAAAQPATNL